MDDVGDRLAPDQVAQARAVRQVVGDLRAWPRDRIEPDRPAGEPGHDGAADEAARAGHQDSHGSSCAMTFVLRMIFSENRYPLFGIMR
jgi:hypothetical protein